MATERTFVRRGGANQTSDWPSGHAVRGPLAAEPPGSRLDLILCALALAVVATLANNLCNMGRHWPCRSSWSWLTQSQERRDSCSPGPKACCSLRRS